MLDANEGEKSLTDGELPSSWLENVARKGAVKMMSSFLFLPCLSDAQGRRLNVTLNHSI